MKVTSLFREYCGTLFDETKEKLNLSQPTNMARYTKTFAFNTNPINCNK